MFNNSVQSKVTEFQRFIEGPNEKMVLNVDKRICVVYSLFIKNSYQEAVINFLSSISKKFKGVNIEYNMLETEKNSELDNTKIQITFIFEKLPIRQRACFFYIAGIIFQVKLALDKYEYGNLAKTLRIKYSFFVKNLQKYNKISVKYQDGDEFVEYFDRLLPGKFTKYTLDVNYDIQTSKNFIIFDAYCGNINSKGISEIYYLIVNNIIVFNNDIVKGFR